MNNGKQLNKISKEFIKEQSNLKYLQIDETESNCDDAKMFLVYFLLMLIFLDFF